MPDGKQVTFPMKFAEYECKNIFSQVGVLLEHARILAVMYRRYVHEQGFKNPSAFR